MQFFIKFIDSEKIRGMWWGQMMMCISCMSNYYLYNFLEIGNNK
jgi:hypothetical protein